MAYDASASPLTARASHATSPICLRADERGFVSRAAARDVAAREEHIAARLVQLSELARQRMRARYRLGLGERRQRRVHAAGQAMSRADAQQRAASLRRLARGSQRVAVSDERRIAFARVAAQPPA